MCLVVNNLDKGSFIGMILAKTLSVLDAVHREEANFFAWSPPLI